MKNYSEVKKSSASNIYKRKSKLAYLLMTIVFMISMLTAFTAPVLAVPISDPDPGGPGAIWTTNSGGARVNDNHYDNKGDVYLNGGPATQNGKGFSGDPAAYYVRVFQTKQGEEVGFSTGAVAEIGADGFFKSVYRLVDIVFQTSVPSAHWFDTSINGVYTVEIGLYGTGVDINSKASRDTYWNKAKSDNFSVGEVKGSITVYKEVLDANANPVISDDTEFSITVEGPDGYIDISKTISDTIDGHATFNNLKLGTYTIAETDIAGYTVVGSLTRTVTLAETVGNYDQSITFINQIDPKGSITIHKVIEQDQPTGDNTPVTSDTTTEFNVTITGPDGPYYRTVKYGTDAVIPNLPLGTYTVSEISKEGYICSTPTQAVNLTTGNKDVKVTFTNVIPAPVAGTITVYKRVIENGIEISDPTPFEVTLATTPAALELSATALPQTKTMTTSSPAVFSGITMGTYEITETAVPGYICSTTPKAITLDTANPSASITITNIKETVVADTYTIIVHKEKILWNDVVIPDYTNFDVTIEDSEGNRQTDFMDLGDNAVFTGLSAGTYKVTESTLEGYRADDGSTDTTNDTTQTVVLGPGLEKDTYHVYFTNIKDPADIVLEKSVNPTSVTLGTSVTYTFSVYNPNDFDLYDVEVNDPLLGGEIFELDVLPGGETRTFTKTYTSPVAGTINNTATVTADYGYPYYYGEGENSEVPESPWTVSDTASASFFVSTGYYYQYVGTPDTTAATAPPDPAEPAEPVPAGPAATPGPTVEPLMEITEAVPAAPVTLPRTGGIPLGIFTGLGGMIAAAGVLLRRRIK